MRTPRLLLLGLAPLALVPACFGGTGIISFPIHEPIDEQVVQGSPIPSVFPLSFPIPLNVDLAAETKSRSTGPAQHVYLTSLVFDITQTKEGAGDTDDFDFLDSAEIYIESTKSGSTLQRRRIAHIDSVPSGARKLTFARDHVDLLDYVNEGARLSISATGTLPPDDTSFDGDVELSVEVL